MSINPLGTTPPSLQRTQAQPGTQAAGDAEKEPVSTTAVAEAVSARYTQELMTSLMGDLAAMRNAARQDVDTLLHQSKDIPAAQRDVIKARVDQQLTAAFDDCVRRIQQILEDTKNQTPDALDGLSREQAVRPFQEAVLTITSLLHSVQTMYSLQALSPASSAGRRA